MAEDLLSRRDLDFLLNEWLNVAKLTERPRYADHGAETFASILDVSEQVARRHFATHFKTGDAREPSFDGTTVTIIPRSAKRSRPSPPPAWSRPRSTRSRAASSCRTSSTARASCGSRPRTSPPRAFPC